MLRKADGLPVADQVVEPTVDVCPRLLTIVFPNINILSYIDC